MKDKKSSKEPQTDNQSSPEMVISEKVISENMLSGKQAWNKLETMYPSKTAEEAFGILFTQTIEKNKHLFFKK